MLSLALQDWMVSMLTDLALEDGPQELGTVLNSALHL